ncbi:mucolipin-3-like [Uloborus diversus]|uniref:mucolipin-3-like n=1 Tax=Uloborus diversus TaxID=327109 RepID=UPI002409D02C|nr:mucolipin-3-like [Uloborus diversus]XP_054722652.1 mucolipin-3-like [Uloborus diversus]
MDATGSKRPRSHGITDKQPFVSPYVEISGDSCENANCSHLPSRAGSVNSFLQEAEIISPASEIRTTKAHDLMRKKLRYFFMNPIQKWRAKGRFPWKLCLQVVKIVVATAQLILFGLHSYRYVRQHLDMTTALSRILLKDWAADVTVYPPSSGPYAVYTIPGFYENIDNIIRQFSKISSMSIAPYSYDSANGSLTSLFFCAKQYNGELYPENSTIEIHDLPQEHCETIPPLYPANSPLWDTFSLEDYLNQTDFSLNFRMLVNAQLRFKLRTVFIKSMTKLDVPECYQLHIIITYDNSEHDGQVLISMKIHSTQVLCHIDSKVPDKGENASYLGRQVLNSFVILLCLVSVILCVRSLFRGYMLGRETVKFFKSYFSKDIPTWEFIDFLDFWYINIVISDIMLIFGSLIKLQIEEKSAHRSEFSKCTILLGVGNLLIWVGLLRYLGFFPKYNMLILTVKRALPNVMRFTLCAVLLYLGFCFCGWLVLSPYHIKFETLSRTSECLFAVMNGDDMFATFALVDTGNHLIWWFSRFYLYLFLLLFVYVVISLFISVIMDTFETIKFTYMHGTPPQTVVEFFLSAESSSVFSNEEEMDELELPETSSLVHLWFKFKSYFQYRFRL